MGNSKIPKIFDPCRSFLCTKIPFPGIREILTFFNSIFCESHNDSFFSIPLTL